MIYVYRCNTCENQEWEISHSMIWAESVNCPVCHKSMSKVPQVPQLITQPFHLRDENRPPEMSAKDRVARMKADDKVYESSYRQTAPDSGQSMVAIGRKKGIL